MSFNSLKIYNSTDEFSIILYDYTNTYILPFISLFGVITSIINVVVLLKIKLNNDINKYLFVKSCCDLTFLTTQCFIFIIRCGRLCSYSYSYSAKFYEAYIFRYFGYVLIFFSCSLDITVSIDRIFSFQSKSRYYKLKIPFKIRCVVLFIISTFICIPQYVLFKIPEAFGKLYVYDSKTNSTSYELLYQLKNRKNEDLKNLVTVLKYIRGYGLFGLLSLLNLIIVYKFKKHLGKKESMTKNGNSYKVKNAKNKKTKKENKTTLMILVICLNYLTGNMLDSFSVSIYFENNILVNNLVYMIGNGLLYISHGVNLFIYLYFDKNFQRKSLYFNNNLQTSIQSLTSRA